MALSVAAGNVGVKAWGGGGGGGEGKTFAPCNTLSIIERVKRAHYSGTPLIRTPDVATPVFRPHRKVPKHAF